MVGWIPKISVACISCTSCQQTRPISLSIQHRISTKLCMQHHIYPLSLLIISFYILTKLLLCYKFSKGHITLTCHVYFWDTSQCMLIEPQIFFGKIKPLNFHFNTRNHFRDVITGLVMNTRLFYNSKERWYVQNNWTLLILYIPHFAVESASEFSLHVLWKMVLLEVRDFQTWWLQSRTLWNVSIYFLLLYRNNVM